MTAGKISESKVEPMTMKMKMAEFGTCMPPSVRPS